MSESRVESDEHTTIFRYRCTSCGRIDAFAKDGRAVYCRHCAASRPLSTSGVIRFTSAQSEQTEYFDELYARGLGHTKDEAEENYTGPYHDAARRSEAYLKACGFDSASGVSNRAILDVACGSGWVTAGLLMHSWVRDCKLHAFDISGEGPDLLARFARTLSSTNHLEISVQSASEMRFAPASFDLVIGSSVLHHFDDFEQFLKDCRLLLGDGGIAVFGEPFALGYGMAAAAIHVAQELVGRKYEAIDAFYNDLAFRIKTPPELLGSLLDKHLFFEPTLEAAARRAGFSQVTFVPWAPREYYRDNFVDDLLSERGIVDAELANRAKSVYRSSFDLFDAASYVHSLAEFIYVVARV